VRIVADEQEFWNRTFDDAPAPGPERSEQPARARTVPRDAFTVRPPSFAGRVLDRVGDWRSDARFGVVVLIAVAVVAGAVWYRIGIGGGSEAGAAQSTPSAQARATRPSATTTTTAAAASAASSDSTARIAVHVAGAVTRPGVVELGAGTRVIDAVEAVGGAHPDADLDRLNLAAKLTDGERVYVPKVGEADPGVLGGSDAAAGTGTSGTGTASGGLPVGKINLNTATEAQLEALPGIGPTYAQSILAERQRRGGFTSVNELRGVRGIGDKRFAELAPLVTV
jgi:competence protein ComEA